MAKQTILVVEDEQVVAMDLSAMLTAHGYAVIDTEDGEQAIGLATRQRPDLVLMDIRLAGPIDGINSAQAIRAHCDIPIIFLTAHSDDATRQRAGLTAPYGFLIKPFDENALFSMIEIVLIRHAHDVEIRAREQWFATTLASIADGVLTTNTQGIVTFLNQSAADLLRISPPDALGRPVEAVMQLIDSGSRQPIIHPIHRILSPDLSGSPVGEHLLINADHAEIWIDDYVAPIMLNLQETLGAVMVLRDASLRRRAEQERREQDRRAEELKHLERLRVLSSGAAHDLNNLLTGMRGYVELARMDIAEPGMVVESLDQIDIIAQRASDLAKHMLAYAGRAALITQTMDLNSIVHESIIMLRQSHLRAVNITIELADDLPMIEGDLMQIRQILLNLLVNAAEAIDPSKGQIILRTGIVTLAEKMISTLTGTELPTGKYVTLEVRDTGIGMDEPTRQRIFEPFFSTKFTGRGMGLAAVMGYLRTHQGTMLVDSAPGTGTLMTVLLPVVESLPAERVKVRP